MTKILQIIPSIHGQAMYSMLYYADFTEVGWA